MLNDKAFFVFSWAITYLKGSNPTLDISKRSNFLSCKPYANVSQDTKQNPNPRLFVQNDQSLSKDYSIIIDHSIIMPQNVFRLDDK